MGAPSLPRVLELYCSRLQARRAISLPSPMQAARRERPILRPERDRGRCHLRAAVRCKQPRGRGVKSCQRNASFWSGCCVGLLPCKVAGSRRDGRCDSTAVTVLYVATRNDSQSFTDYASNDG